MKVWLIGENNPYGSDPKYDLFPYPERSAGARLQRDILGMRRDDYLQSFERRNLLAQTKWSMPAARGNAEWLRNSLDSDDRVILLGKKVFDAWCSEPGNWRD